MVHKVGAGHERCALLAGGRGMLCWAAVYIRSTAATH